MKEPEISPVHAVQHPLHLDYGPLLVKIVVLEWAGALPGYLWHWPWWIGAQLPIAYLVWKLAQERAFAFRVVSAWNKKLRAGRDT
jgi:hypothetical protein